MTTEIIKLHNQLTPVNDSTQPEIEQLRLEYEEVKANLQAVSEQNEKALGVLLQLAVSSQHYKLYEAYASLVQAANETQKQLANTLRHKQSLLETHKLISSTEAPTTVNNNLNITSTDLIDMIKRNNGISE